MSSHCGTKIVFTRLLTSDLGRYTGGSFGVFGLLVLLNLTLLETRELPHTFVQIYDDAEAGLPLPLLGEAPLGQWRRYQNSWLIVARPLMEFPNDPTERAAAMADWVSEKMDEAFTLIRGLRAG
jgi:hypothetical protein